MQTLTTDVAVIGAGTAGMSAWRAARSHTPNVLLIERAQYDTTCARVGCMPSKLLIAAAEAAHGIEQAGVFGVHGGSLKVDGPAVMARVRAERDRFVGFVVEAVEAWPVEQRLMGHARFVGPHALEVQTAEGTVRVQAGRIVIATGSRPAMPLAWGEALGDRLIVNDDVFDWQTLPGSVAVIGAGVIGLELAQALHRLGVRVRLYGRGPRIGPLTDPALQAVAAAVFGRQLPLQLDAHQLEVRRDGEQVIVHTVDGGGVVHEERFDFLLAATGRRPNVDDIGLAHSGLVLDAGGVPVYDRRTGQAGNSAVFIAGDAADERPLLHEAADEGRSRVMARNAGALRVYGSPNDGRLLGAEMIGPAAEHIGHLLAWSVQRGDTVQQMLDSPFYHPVVEEGLRTALRLLQRALRMGPPPVEHCLDCGPGA